MPVPHDQIAGLGVGDALKAFDSGVEIVGIRVGIGESRAFINGVNQVRAIVLRVSRHLGIERRGDHGEAIVWSQGVVGFSGVIPARARPHVVGSLSWARGLLRGADS
jgi:hypothetical protein